MPDITLPDGKKINFEKSISGFEVAEKISKSLSKQALLISVDGELKDLNHIISKDSSNNLDLTTELFSCEISISTINFLFVAAGITNPPL